MIKTGEVPLIESAPARTPVPATRTSWIVDPQTWADGVGTGDAMRRSITMVFSVVQMHISAQSPASTTLFGQTQSSQPSRWSSSLPRRVPAFEERHRSLSEGHANTPTKHMEPCCARTLWLFRPPASYPLASLPVPTPSGSATLLLCTWGVCSCGLLSSPPPPPPSLCHGSLRHLDGG